MTMWDDYLAEERRWIAEQYVKIAPPPTRAETIIDVWPRVSAAFDYAAGRLLVRHDLDVIEPIVFELIDYQDVTVIEAEGVVVAKFPRIR